MKKFKLSLILAVFSLVLGSGLVTGCSNNSYQSVDLDRVLKIMSATLTTAENQSSQASEEEVMILFTKQFQKDLNHASPKLHAQTIGVILQEDGSVKGYNDKNSNAVQDSGERLLFKVEIDGQNNRLVASEGQQVRSQHFSGTGLIAGMLIGNMLARQRTTGVNPSSISNKKATPKTSTKKTTSAKSRSGSGSFSKGK